MSSRAWPALDIHVPGCDPLLQDLVLAQLDDFQPAAIQEPDDRQPLRAFFTTPGSRDAAARAIGAAFGSRLFVEAVDVEDQDWAARSQAGLTAVTVGRIIITPPWDVQRSRQAEEDSRVVIVIQPSMGFGTGHHATTRLMLGALQELDVRERTVLDIGCGSGVLAIAAARLGARAAVGVDVDPDALESAAENVDLNDARGVVRLEQGDFRERTQPAAIVLANLTGALLERHAATLAALVEPGGVLVASGFMNTEPAVIPALEQHLTRQKLSHEDEWQCIVLRKS